MRTETKPIIPESALLGKLVLDRHTAETVGRVEHLWLDEKMGQVVRVTCKSGLLGHQKHTFTWAQVDSVGADSMMVTLPGEGELEVPEGIEPPVGHELWTDSGNRVGQIRDYQINLETGDVVDFLFTPGGWRGVTEGVYCLPPDAIVSVGRKRIICQESAIEQAEQIVEGLEQRLNQVREFLQKDYQRTQEHMKSAAEGTQAIATQAQDTAQSATTVAQNALSTLGEKAKQLQEKVGSSFKHEEVATEDDGATSETSEDQSEHRR
jgi:uncharacterized protein YrrD